MKNALILAGLVLLVASAVIFDISRHSSTVGEDNAKVWFYNQENKRLYAVPRDTVPPDDSAGVRAMVVAFPGQEKNRDQWRIAYLQTYSPELKSVLEAVRKAHEANVPYAGTLPSRDGTWSHDNTLVKRVDDTDWSTVSSDKGRKILHEWESWRSPSGEPPIICVP